MPRKELGGISFEEKQKIWWAGRGEKIAHLLMKSSIPNLKMKEIMEIYKHLKVARARRHPDQFKSNSVSKIRKSLYYLLYSSDTIQKRFTEFTSKDGKYKLEGIAEDFASIALYTVYPEDYVILNEGSKLGLRVLGINPPKIRGESNGEKYHRYNEAVKAAMKLAGLSDLGVTDKFLYLLSNGTLLDLSTVNFDEQRPFQGFTSSDFEVFEQQYNENKKFDSWRCEIQHKIEWIRNHIEPYILSIDSRLISKVSSCKITRTSIRGIWTAFTLEKPYPENPQLNFGIYENHISFGIQIPRNCTIARRNLGKFFIENPEFVLELNRKMESIFYQAGDLIGHVYPFTDVEDIIDLGKEYFNNSGWATFAEARNYDEKIVTSHEIVDRITEILKILYPIFIHIVGEQDSEDIVKDVEKSKKRENRKLASQGSSRPPNTDEYVRSTSKSMRVIIPRHRILVERFWRWLKDNGFKDVRFEKKNIDIVFTNGNTEYMVEAKVVYNISSKLAIRDALGQILEYNYYNAQEPYPKWLILLDDSPDKRDFKYIRKISRIHGLPLNLAWYIKGVFKFMNPIK